MLDHSLGFTDRAEPEAGYGWPEQRYNRAPQCTREVERHGVVRDGQTRSLDQRGRLPQRELSGGGMNPARRLASGDDRRTEQDILAGANDHADRVERIRQLGKVRPPFGSPAGTGRKYNEVVRHAALSQPCLCPGPVALGDDEPRQVWPAGVPGQGQEPVRGMAVLRDCHAPAIEECCSGL